MHNRFLSQWTDMEQVQLLNILVKQKPYIDRDQRQHGSQFVSFYNMKWGFVYTFHQLLINWLLWRDYFGSLEHALVALSSVERWQL